MSLLFNNPAWSTPAFNPQEQQPMQQKKQGLLGGFQSDDLIALGTGLLSMSGPSQTPTSFGQALGVGANNLQASQRQRQEDEYRQKMFDMQKQKHEYDMNQGQQRKIIKGVDGRNYYADTQEPVLPGVEAPQEQLKPTSVMQNAEALGLKPGTQPYYDYIRETTKKGALVNNNIGGEAPWIDQPLKISELKNFRNDNGEQPKGVMTHRELRDGGYTMQERPNESDRKAKYVANSLGTASKKIDNVLKDYDPTTLTELARSQNNFTASGDSQKYKASTDEWATNMVFLRSGATAREEEKLAAFKNFFPQPGDKPEVIKFKNELRKEQEINAYKAAKTGNRISNKEADENIARLEAELNQLNNPEDLSGMTDDELRAIANGE